MPGRPRTFRVFVSSTFADLQAERKALQTFVFPRLRELCAAYGARFQAVDLRWGISREAGEDQQTLDICLREVERCQRLTPRPNFLILVGERYGWRPLAPRIPIEDFDALHSAVESDADRRRLSDLYTCDDNVQPPVFVLRRRAELRSPAGWAEAERAVAVALHRAVAQLGWVNDRAAPYVTSATEREIRKGAFSVPDANQHVFALHRRIAALPRDARAGAFLDMDAEARIDPEAARYIEALRSRLEQQLAPRVVQVVANWSPHGLSAEHLGNLPSDLQGCLPLLDARPAPTTVCEAVWQALGRVILAQCAHVNDQSALDVERDAHVRFRDERAAILIGRESELARIAAYLDGDDTAPLAVLGTYGSGKSALMARAVAIADARAKATAGTASPAIVFRFVGASAASTSGVLLLRSLAADIGAGIGAVDAAPATLKGLIDWLPKLLLAASAGRRLILFIDALDQLGASDGARTLAWLPHALPRGVRVVVSAAPGDVTAVLEGRQPTSAIVRVEPLGLLSGGDLLDTWLRDADRALQPSQRDRVLTSFARSGLPLHLRMAFEESRRWRSFDPLVDLADDVPGLVRRLFARLSQEANHGAVLVERSLAYLVAARNGLTEDELIDVLSADGSVMSDVRRRSPDSPLTDRLPPIIWSRFFDEIEPYLSWQDADGTSTLHFFHRQLAGVAADDFLPHAVRTARHAALAAYFAEQSPTASEAGAPNLRRLSELPWHLAGAGRWNQYVDTVVNFQFLDARLHSAGPQALVDDLDLALDEESARGALPPPALEALKTLRALIRLTTHILGKDPTQFVAQLVGRIDGHDNVLLARILEDATAHAPVPSLQPVAATLAPPGGDLVATLQGHEKEVYAVGITPDGALGVSGSADGTIRLWDLDRQAERFVIPVGHGEVRSVAVVPDGRSVVSGSEDGSLDVWNAASGALVRRWQGQGRWRALVMTPDGTRLLSGSDGPAVVWDFATGKPLTTITPESRATIAMAISEDARRAIIGGIYDYVSVFDLEHGRELATLIQGRDSWVSAVAMTPDGKYAFSADWEGRTRVWNVDAQQQIGQLMGHGFKKITAIALTPDGSMIATADNYGRIVLHRWQVGSETAGAQVRDQVRDVVLKVVSTAGHGVQQLAITPDGARAITSGSDGTLRVWDLAPDPKQTAPISLGGYWDEVSEAAFAEAWERVVVTETHAAAPPAFDVFAPPSSAAGSQPWSIVPKRLLPRRPRRDDDDDDDAPAPRPIAFQVTDSLGANQSPEIETGPCMKTPVLSPDRRVMLSIADDGVVSMWHLASGERLEWPDGPLVWTPPVGTPKFDSGPRFSPDGTHLVAVQQRRLIGVWRVADRRLIAQFDLTVDAEVGIAPDGGCAWWFTRDGRLRHWTIGFPEAGETTSPASGQLLGRPRIVRIETPSARLSTDGRFMLDFNKDDSRIRVWRLPRKTPIVDRVVPNVQSVAVLTHHDGRARGAKGLLAVGAVRLDVYDLASMRGIAAFEADAPIVRCAFSDATTVVAVAADDRRHTLRIRTADTRRVPRPR